MFIIDILFIRSLSKPKKLNTSTITVSLHLRKQAAAAAQRFFKKVN